MIFLDCELHNLESLEVIKARPVEGSHTQYPLQAFVSRGCSPKRLSQLAYDFYWQVLIPFATTILLFFEDLGGLGGVVEIVANWVRLSVANPTLSPPRILVLYDCKNKVQAERFTTLLRARVAAFIRDLEPGGANVGDGMVFECRHTFESLRLVSTIAATAEYLHISIEESFSFREQGGYAFSGEHAKLLLQAALQHFCLGNSQQLDLYFASRAPNPVSNDLESHLDCFIYESRNVGIEQAEVVASALDLDAHPPGMHRKNFAQC